MDSAVATLSEISISYISESAKKEYEGLHPSLKRKVQEKFSGPIPTKSHEAYRAGTAREYELYHLRLTKNFRVVTRKLDERYVILAISNHDDAELFAHNYRGQAPARIYSLLEAGIVPDEQRKPALGNPLLAPSERHGEDSQRQRQAFIHPDDELIDATLELASILRKNAFTVVQEESSQMRAISESLRIDFEHKLQTLGGEKQQLASRVDSLATRVDECARRELAQEQLVQGQATEFEQLRGLLDERHAVQASQLASLGETMRHAEGAILEQDQRIDAVQQSATDLGQQTASALAAIKERQQQQSEQAAAAADRLETLVRAVGNRLEAVQGGLEAQQAALSRVEAEIVAQRTRAESAWAARSRDWAELRESASAQQALVEQLQREVAALPALASAQQEARYRTIAQGMEALQTRLAALQNQFAEHAAQQHERQVEQQRNLAAEMLRLRSELSAAAAAKPWWRRLFGGN